MWPSTLAAARCARHVDNPTGRNGRVLSALYLNPGWMVHDHSGCLRLWTQDQSSPAEVIAPLPIGSSSSGQMAGLRNCGPSVSRPFGIERLVFGCYVRRRLLTLQL